MPDNNVDVILRVLNGRRFQAEMYGAGRSVRNVGSAFASTSGSASGLSAAATAASQALYGIGEASHIAVYGAGAVAAAWVATGVQFNATMEANTLAFEHFTGGVQQAQAFTKQLFEFAKSSPFSFEDITQAARRFLAFGFNVKETTGLLKTMADTISYTGGSTDEILRFAKALGDIRSKGRLMQQEMNQLTNLNIPIREILSKGGLELTERQLKNVGRAGIDAETAISAIQTGLNKMYGGGAQAYLQTFNGQWQRLTDNIKMAAGSTTQTTGIFAFLKRQLQAMNEMLEGKRSLPGWIQAVIDFLPKLLPIGKAVFGGVSGFASDLWENLKPARPFLENVILPLAAGILTGVGGTIKGAVGILGVFARILGVVGNLLKPFKGLFYGIGVVIGFVFGGEIIKALQLLGKLPGVFRLIGVAAGFLLAPVRIVGSAFEALTGFIFRLLNPGAITGLINEIVAAFNGFAPKFMQIGANLAQKFVMGLATMTEKIGSAIFRGMAMAFIWAVNKAIGIFNTAIGAYNKIPLAPNIDKITPIAGLATGGYITSGGWAMVGENGPEFAKFPVGTSVHNPRMATADTSQNGEAPGFAPARIMNKQPIYIGRRQIGEAVGEYVAERDARR